MNRSNNLSKRTRLYIMCCFDSKKLRETELPGQIVWKSDRTGGTSLWADWWHNREHVDSSNSLLWFWTVKGRGGGVESANCCYRCGIIPAFLKWFDNDKWLIWSSGWIFLQGWPLSSQTISFTDVTFKSSFVWCQWLNSPHYPIG